MARHHVGRCQQFIEFQDARPQLGHHRQVGIKIGIIGGNVHAEGRGTAGGKTADPAQPDHPQSLAVQFASHELVTGPAPAFDMPVGGGDFSHQGQHQAQRQLGHGEGVLRGRESHHHAGPAGGLDVYVIQADAGPGDDLQVFRRRNQFGRDGRLVAHDQGPRRSRGHEQTGAIFPEFRLAGYRVELLQFVDRGPADVFRN